MIKHQEKLQHRAKLLNSKGLNGLKLVIVTLFPKTNPTKAYLDLYFHNENELANILIDPADPKFIFPVSGGHRLKGGSANEQVKVTEVSGLPAHKYLTLTIEPIGDYSTYVLGVNFQNIDPLFNEIAFKFRPGCFNLCAPEWSPLPAPPDNPEIDYLAKDYESFKHTMINAMIDRIPGWQPTSEADFDQVLLELFSAAADDLSDFQDRVMNEAYLVTARKRVSLARHARLMDYHIHQGNQASTWLSIQVAANESFYLDKHFQVWTDPENNDASSINFLSKKRQFLHHFLNNIHLYTWSDSIPSLAAGSTMADLKLEIGGQVAADIVRDLIRNGKITRLLIQERLNPMTGAIAGKNPEARQILRLIPGAEGASTLQDPLTGEWMVRINWLKEDQLKQNYCFVTDCQDEPIKDVSLFHGNLVEVFHGKKVTTTFVESTKTIASSDTSYIERNHKWGTICRLPEGPLAYCMTAVGGDIPPVSTLGISDDSSGAFIDVVLKTGVSERWDEVINLIHSDDSAELGNHFMVETDEHLQSILRFGNGINGKELPENAKVVCTYQTGVGTDGNIGHDKLVNFDKNKFPLIVGCWNPFEVSNGQSPEPRVEIIRRVPEAYRFKQLRAVTLKDYVNRAEELAAVSKASARYVWTGSWRSVQIAIDPLGTTELTDALRNKLSRHLDAVRLIGEDLELRPPIFIPLEINVKLCIHQDYWEEDIRYILEQTFSDGYTPEGIMAFFHPDRWTFGQEIRASQIIGSIQKIPGVDNVLAITIKRMGETKSKAIDVLPVRSNEIIQVKNNRDHREDGYIYFNIKGGRR